MFKGKIFRSYLGLYISLTMCQQAWLDTCDVIDTEYYNLSIEFSYILVSFAHIIFYIPLFGTRIVKGFCRTKRAFWEVIECKNKKARPVIEKALPIGKSQHKSTQSLTDWRKDSTDWAYISDLLRFILPRTKSLKTFHWK